MSGLGDISALPPPDAVATLDFEAVRAELLDDIVARQPDLAPALALEVGATVRQVEAFAYRDTVHRADLNAAVRACMLATATGADLVNLAANLGVSAFPGEPDDRLRARAADSFNGSSVAGPAAAYRRHAIDADGRIADVQVTNPSPGVVRLAVLTKDVTGAAPPDLLAVVYAALSADDVRPLTDQVVVVSATVTPYDVTGTLHLASGLDAATVQAAAAAAVQAYADARRALNKGVAQKGIIAALMQPGVDNVDVSSPFGDLPAIPGAAYYLRTLTLATQLGGGGV